MRTQQLTICELAFATPTIGTQVLWHRRFNDQPAHRWLRDLVRQAAIQ